MKRLSSEPMSREQLSAWQRWEMASFDHGAASGGTASGPAARALVDAEAAALRAQATAAGHAEGYAAGVAQAAADRERLQQLLAVLATYAGEHEQRLVDEVLDLALVLARQLVGEALAVRREFVLPVVSAALKQLPQSTQRIQVLLNPADTRLVETILASEAATTPCNLVPDATIAPGGCRIETEQCDLDATTPTRWRRLLASLGRSDDWLEPA